MAGSSDPSASSDRWLGDAAVFHGEGAFWDADAHTLRYVDMLAGDVITVAGSGQHRTHLGPVAAMIRSRKRGGYVVASERGFQLLDEALRIEQEIVVFDDPDVRMNEGACDAAGRLFCGSMAYDARPGGGRLYRLDPDLTVHVVRERVTIPNGLVWTSDGSRALHADTGDRAVYAYAFDAARGTLGDREVFVDFAGATGAPDGMAADREGGVWIALWGGGAVHRYDAEGALTQVIDLPVTNVTSCAFGGPAGTTLFVTTSRDGIAPDSEPFAGRVCRFEVGVPGADVHRFGG